MIDPKQIKALFFDVDGTLVSYQNHRIHPQDLKTLAVLHERGIKLFIASGRDFAIPQEAATITEAAPYMDGYIGINGQHCELADGTVVSSYVMDDGDLQRVRKCCEENRIAMLYYLGTQSYVTELTDNVYGFAEYVGLPVHPVRPLAPEEPTPRKVCIYVSEADEIRLLRPLLKHTQTANNRDFLSDMIPEGVGKDSGIRDICTYLGIDPQETMAFGDGENDLSMLRAAGIGVAMGSAPDNVKESADYVTGTAEDAGITQALEHFGIL